jgi:hypothetical protein
MMADRKWRMRMSVCSSVQTPPVLASMIAKREAIWNGQEKGAKDTIPRA